ncbi:carbohydrate-binding protein [Puia sp. P3]|uniref:carbohydrate-binding protein n=1 Tax=Puia sp. P3 TaxID=3423952 RepID=UPI003D668D25
MPTLRGIGLTPAGGPIQLDRYTRIDGARSVFLDSLERIKGWKVVFDAPGSSVQYNSVDFGKTPWKSLTAKVASSSGGVLEVRAGASVIGEVDVPAGGGWRVVSVPLKGKVSGVKNLLVVGKAAGLQVDWIRFDSTSG